MGCRNAEKGHAGGCWRTALVDSITQPILPNPAVFKILDLDDFWFIYISAWRGGEGHSPFSKYRRGGGKEVCSFLYISESPLPHTFNAEIYMRTYDIPYTIPGISSIRGGGGGYIDRRSHIQRTNFLSIPPSFSLFCFPSFPCLTKHTPNPDMPQ